MYQKCFWLFANPIATCVRKNDRPSGLDSHWLQPIGCDPNTVIGLMISTASITFDQKMMCVIAEREQSFTYNPYSIDGMDIRTCIYFIHVNCRFGELAASLDQYKRVCYLALRTCRL